MEQNHLYGICFFLELLLLIAYIDDVTGHGGLIEPPMRSIAWKYGFDTPVNYDWMGLYCGGLGVFQKNGGKCGLCGDPYDGPFENDKGGVYDTGIIVRHYPVGLQDIEVKVELTAHHKGYFQFKLCPNNESPLTQSCLDRYPLVIQEARTHGDPYKFYPPKEPKLSELHVLLPPDVTCDRCVLQWTYTAGNSAGRDESGKSCLGCGIQETFVNCADISIGGNVDRIPVAESTPQEGPVIVFNRRPDLTEIIENASAGSFNNVLRALSNANNPMITRGPIDQIRRQPNIDNNNNLNNNNGHTIGWGGPRGIENQVPHMFLPPVDGHHTGTTVPPISFGHNVDLPGFTRNSFGHQRTPSSTNVHDLAVARANEIFRQQRFWQGQNHHNSFQGQGSNMIHHVTQMPSTFMPQQGENFRPFNVLPPSKMVQHRLHNFNKNINAGDRHDTLLGSVSGVAGQVRPGTRTQTSAGFSRQANQEPSREFIQQMNELRQNFPNVQEWRRGDGMTSSDHAVRPASHLDTHNFSEVEIRNQVPSLPQDIGPRQDLTRMNDHRVHPNMMHQRQNWFPASQFMVRSDTQSQNFSQLPRRIEVPSMAVAQHLLRKYPQLRGRVYLSRDAHLRNQFAHMMQKYARRRTFGI